MRGVSTHVSNLNISTVCTTTLNNIPDTLGLEPSRPIILISRAQLFRAVIRFPTTARQLSYTTVKTIHIYLNEVTVLSVLP